MNQETGHQPAWQCWAIVELMGHVRVAGFLTEEERFGVKMGRLEVPLAAGGSVTQYFAGQSVYRLTPCSEAVARSVALSNQPAPVHSWELPKAIEAPKEGACVGGGSLRLLGEGDGPHPEQDEGDWDDDAEGLPAF